MKVCLRIFFLCLFLQSCNTSRSQNGIDIYGKVKIPFDKAILITEKEERILVDGNDEECMVTQSYIIGFTGKTYRMVLFIRPRKGVGTKKISEITKINSLSDGSVNFGIGDEYEFVNEYSDEQKSVDKGKIEVKKKMTEWGGVARNLLIYHLKFNDDVIEDCIIEFADLFPEGYGIEEVRRMINEKKKNVEIFRYLDKAIYNATMI